MKKIIQIVDSKQYVETNCYQHQLLVDLKKNFDHVLIQLADLPNSLPDDVTVLSTVKIRNVYKYIDKFANVFKHKNILIYDQDPWESFIDEATYPNGYHNLVLRLPNVEFINISKWWSDYVISKGLKSHFCRIWILPEYCSIGEKFENRHAGISFKGTVHSYRKEAFEKMMNLGCEINISPSSPRYIDWLDWLKTQQAFLFDETPKWKIDGIETFKNVQQIKSVEILSQGCFVFHDCFSVNEQLSYELTNVPCNIEYDSFEHCVELHKNLLLKPVGLINEMIIESVNKIKEIDGWVNLRNILNSHIPRVYTNIE